MKENEKAAQWLNRARSSLQRSKIGAVDPYIFLEDLCYDAQQTAEKSIKAVFILYHIKFPKTHDIGYLLDILDTNNIFIPNDILEGRILTQYAIETRYPGDYEPITEDEYNEALKISSEIFKWADSLINKK